MTSAAPTPGETAPDARADALVASYVHAGYARVAPAMLQPAEPFLDLSGEDIRKRMFLTVDPQGRELCLRPDLTIPVSRDYLASPRAGKAEACCYLGPIFRHRTAEVSGSSTEGEAPTERRRGLEEPAEFMQAGIESFGRCDTAAADADILVLGLAATAHYGLPAPDILIGD